MGDDLRQLQANVCNCDINALLETEGQYSRWNDKAGYVFCGVHGAHRPFVWERTGVDALLPLREVEDE